MRAYIVKVVAFSIVLTAGGCASIAAGPDTSVVERVQALGMPMLAEIPPLRDVQYVLRIRLKEHDAGEFWIEILKNAKTPSHFTARIIEALPSVEAQVKALRPNSQSMRPEDILSRLMINRRSVTACTVLDDLALKLEEAFIPVGLSAAITLDADELELVMVSRSGQVHVTMNTGTNDAQIVRLARQLRADSRRCGNSGS